MTTRILQFNCLTHNEIARKAMDSYIEILQKAFEHYQNLLEDYIKLQEECRQCNAHSSSQVTIDTKIKDEETFQQANTSTNEICDYLGENNSIPLLALSTLNSSINRSINFNSDTETNLQDMNESLYKNINENNRPENRGFSKIFPKTSHNSVKKFVRLPEVCNDHSTSDMKTHDNMEIVSSKYNHKLKISTTHHVETTFLPDGKRLKQSRLAFYPVKSNKKIELSSSVDKHKLASISHNVEQNFAEEISVANAIANATKTEKDATNDISEISEDVIEISPTQKNITSKVKRCLKLKRKIPTKRMITISPSKNKCLDYRSSSNVVPEIINIDFGLCPSPKHTSTQMEDDKFLNIAVNTLKDKGNTSYLSPIKMHNKINVQAERSNKARKEGQLLINKAQNHNNVNDLAYEDKTFYLPTVVDKNDIDNLYLGDSENKPPEKKMLLDKFNILSKKKTDVSEQFNMRCKADRAKLNGLDCWECRKYYKNLSLTEEELQKRMNQCSRHRHKYERPNTPEGFWDPEFPETLSCTYRQIEN